MKLFGREPTQILQAVSALLTVIITFGVPEDVLNANTQTLIIAFIGAGFGLWNAYLVRPWTPGAFIAFATAGAALLAGYGLNIPQDLVGSIVAAIPILLALQTRAQVTPKVDPRPSDQVVSSPETTPATR